MVGRGSAMEVLVCVCPCLCFVDIISANKAIERFDESEAEEVAVLLDIRLLQTFRCWEEFGRLAQ